MSAIPLPASADGHPELAVAWVLHGLEPDDDEAFADHLETCPACLRIVAETEETTSLLGVAMVESVEPPASLRASILAAAVADEVEVPPVPAVPAVSDGTSRTLGVSDPPRSSGPEAGAHGSGLGTDASEPGAHGSGRDPDASETGPGATVIPMRSRRWVRRATAGVALAAALALVVVIGGLVNANRELADQRDTAAAQAARAGEVAAVLDAAARPGTPHSVLATPSGGFVGLVVDRGRGPELLASGLRPNDADHTYVLWGLADGKPVGLRAFDMSDSGPVTASVPSTSAGPRFAGFAVSLEPGRTVPASPTQVVASGQLTG